MRERAKSEARAKKARTLSHLTTLDSRRSPGGKEVTARSLIFWGCWVLVKGYLVIKRIKRKTLVTLFLVAHSSQLIGLGLLLIYMKWHFAPSLLCMLVYMNQFQIRGYKLGVLVY